MPIVTLQSTLYRVRDIDAAVPDPVVVAGVPRVTTGSVANAADDSSGSMYKLASLPSQSIMDPASFLQVDGWGFASVRVGTIDDNDALVSVAKSAGATVSPIAAGDAKWDKRLWEVLGLSEDPGGWIDIYAHAVANATGAGTLRFRFVTLRD